MSSTGLKNQHQASLLVQGAEAGDFPAVEALIAAGVDVNSANEHGMTALMAAAANGHLALVSFLLESGADFKATRHDGFDALALAVFYGRLGIVRELIGSGADPNANDRLGTSPEIWATVRGFHDIAEVLTDAQRIDSDEPVAHQSEGSMPSPALFSAQEPVVNEALFSDQELSDETLSQEATALQTVITQPPKALDVEKQPSSADSTPYVPKPRYYHKRKSPNPVESSYVESTYIAKPRYHHKRKSGKLVRWLAYITSDWQRLTFVTLIVMAVCGLGTAAVLNLLGVSKMSQADQPAIVTEAATPDDSHFNAQNDLQFSTPPRQIVSKRPESDATVERSTLTEKKNNDRSGPQVDRIENSSRLRDVKSGQKSFERVNRVNPKEAITPRQKTQEDSRSAQGFKSSIVSSKGSLSTKAVGADQEESSRAKAPSQTFPRTPSIKTQRPRRVAERNDRLAPASTSGRSTKGKVIQWP